MSAPVADCCRRVPPNHWNNHNRQVRLNGRCGCACHGGNRSHQKSLRHILTREQLLRYHDDLQRQGSLSREAVQRLIDSHLAAVTT